MNPGGWSEVTLRRWALVGFGLVTVIAVVNPALGQGIAGQPGLVHENAVVNWTDSVFCLLMAASGLLILWYRPRNSVGWLLVLVGLLEAACTLGQTYGARSVAFPDEHLPLGMWALELSGPLWVPPVALLVTCMLLRYPSGHIDGRWARRVDRAVIVGLVLMYVGYAGSEHSVTDEIVGRLPPLLLPKAFGGLLMSLGGIATLAGAAFTLVHTVRRTWRAGYPERQQLAWLVTMAPACVVLLFTPWDWTQRFFWGIPVAVAVGVLRYRLLGIEVVVRRTLLYGTLTGLVLLVFAAATWALSTVIPSGEFSQVLAAGLVAVGVVPLRDRLQRLVDRFVYGDRGDPLAALRRLGAPVGLTADAALLPEVLSGIASALRVPGAELVGQRGARAVLGVVGDDTVDLPLVMGGEGVGVLRLARRAGESQLAEADHRLLEGLVPLVAAVLRSVELTSALEVEREKVVAATTTERARLRQDLHDGLGPSLTGIGLGLEALEAKVGRTELVTRLRGEATSSLEEVRRIIDGLRPGALEDADLVTVLRARATQVSRNGLRVRVEAPASLPHLSTEAEAAVLRIVDEALTNVVRHAGARACTIRVVADGCLHVDVMDDGVGYRGPREGGVGVGSMRARATQLGGCFTIETGNPGTRVTVELPLVVPA